MEFAKGLLMKYGWTEGKGLGASESGIVNPVKASLKLNLHGVGHDVGKDFKFHWWDHVYNKAVKNISVNELENGGVELTQEKELNISTKAPSRASRKKAVHGNFVSGGHLIGSTEVSSTAESNSSDSEDEVRHDLLSNLSNDELFNICGGLTAHKGARHGINMTAKLARIEYADAKLEEANAKLDTEIEFNSKEKHKKKKKKKVRDKKKEEEKFDDFVNEFNNHGIDVKKRKSVRFAECMEDVQEFFSHRRIISKGKKRPIENKDVDEEIDVGMDDIVCEEEKKFDCKKRKRKSCEMDDTFDNFEEGLFLDANDSLLVNKFSKIKENKHRLRDEFIEDNVTTPNLDDSDTNDFVDAVEKKDEINIAKKIKKNKHKLQDNLIENNVTTCIVEDSDTNDFIETVQNDINISKKIKKNKHKLQDNLIENNVTTCIAEDSDTNDFIETVQNEINISKKIKKNKHKLKDEFLENNICTPILDELPLQKLKKKKKKSKSDILDEIIYEGEDSFEDEDTHTSKKKKINL